MTPIMKNMYKIKYTKEVYLIRNIGQIQGILQIVCAAQ